MDSNDVELRSLELKIENLEKLSNFLKDEVWHLQIDVIAMKTVLDNMKGKRK